MVARIGVLPLMRELVTCTTQHVVRREKGKRNPKVEALSKYQRWYRRSVRSSIFEIG